MRARKAAVERREEVVEAALRLAGEVGPERLTTAAIADAVGVTQAAVFRHFPKKQDIWDAVAARIADRLDAAWTDALGDAATPAARLAALVQGQLAMV
ncbi:MAG TPA: TetR family transcriptional regulator, partial [Azospirillum sp.]